MLAFGRARCYATGQQLAPTRCIFNQAKCYVSAQLKYFANCYNQHSKPTTMQLIGSNAQHNTSGPLASRNLWSHAVHSRGYSSCGQRPSCSIILGHHVKQALANNCPVVALESTVITHGLPEPNNLELALRLEHEIASGEWLSNREQEQEEEALSDHHRGQVTPATIGIVKGQIIVGLNRDEIEYLARTQSSKPIKASRRDIPLAQAMGLSAGTTVSATMAIATSVSDSNMNKNANMRIAVFATGGLGGVHLGGEQSMDISADLYEMARSPIGVVSSGFKSFLDTRRSLEYLETMGCTVASLLGGDAIYQAPTSVASGTLHHRQQQQQQPNQQNGHDNLKANQTSTSSAAGGAVRLSTVDQKRAQLFPGFFTCVNKEQVKSPWQCDTIQEAAQILFHCLGPVEFTKNSSLSSSSPSPSFLSGGDKLNEWQQRQQQPIRRLQNPRAMLLACPIPSKFSLDEGDDEGGADGLAANSTYAKTLIEISTKIDRRQDLSGNEKTPLILAELARATGGRTLEANLVLLRNNARIGAHLAYEHSKLANRTGAIMAQASSSSTPSQRAQVQQQQQQQQQQQHLILHKNNHDQVSVASRSTEAETQVGGNRRFKVVSSNGTEAKRGRPIVIGCTMVDMHVRTEIDEQFKLNPHYSGVTFQGEPHMTLGGVGRNLATALELLGHEPIFITSLAQDNLAEFALTEMGKFGFGLGDSSSDLSTPNSRLRILNWHPQDDKLERSSCFALVLIDSITGQCEYVIANLNASQAISSDTLNKLQFDTELNDSARRLRREGSGSITTTATAAPSPSLVTFEDQLKATPLVVLDSNLPKETLEYLIKVCYKNSVPIFLEPTDVACLHRVVASLQNIRQQEEQALSSLVYLSPNVVELNKLVELFNEENKLTKSTSAGSNNTQAAAAAAAAAAAGESYEAGPFCIDHIEAKARQLMQEHLPSLKCLLVTMDKQGVLVGTRTSSSSSSDRINCSSIGGKNGTSNQSIIFEHFKPSIVIESPISASGAGDCFASGFICGLLDQLQLNECIELGFKASSCALKDKSTVPLTLKQLVSSHE